MLLSALVVGLVVLVAATLAAVLTAVPFVVAVDLAERRGFSTTRWGGVQLVLLGLAAAVGWVGLRHAGVLVLVVPVLCWATPLLLVLLGGDDSRVGGYRGAHTG